MCFKHCLSQHVCSTKRLSLPQASRIMQVSRSCLCARLQIEAYQHADKRLSQCSPWVSMGLRLTEGDENSDTLAPHFPRRLRISLNRSVFTTIASRPHAGSAFPTLAPRFAQSLRIYHDRFALKADFALPTPAPRFPRRLRASHGRCAFRSRREPSIIAQGKRSAALGMPPFRTTSPVGAPEFRDKISERTCRRVSSAAAEDTRDSRISSNPCSRRHSASPRSLT